MERSRIGCTHSQANCRRVKPQHPHCLTPPQRASEVWTREEAGPQIGGYPRNASKVFYQIDLLAGPEVRSPFDFYVHERGRLRTIPMFRNGMTPLGRRLLDERAWLSRTNPHYVIIRPWLKARQKR